MAGFPFRLPPYVDHPDRTRCQLFGKLVGRRLCRGIRNAPDHPVTNREHHRAIGPWMR